MRYMSAPLSRGKLDPARSELRGSIMNPTPGESKGITCAEMLFFPVGVLEVLDKNKSVWEISLLQPAPRYLDGLHEKPGVV